MPSSASQTIRSVCVVLVDRANYGRLKPVMAAIQADPRLKLQVCCAGTMVLERFDRPVEIVRADGFPVDAEIYIELEGSVPVTMAKSVGLGIVEFANALQHLRPDVLLVIGDRYEALAVAIAGAYMNIPIVHMQGGEITGSIDESARHAISKFAQFHIPATQRARENLLRMGERPETILTVGCPSSDLARVCNRTLRNETINGRGSGAHIDVTQPFLLVVFHPTTTEFGNETGQIREVLAALGTVQTPTLALWPNIDAGSSHINKEIRKFRVQHATDSWLRVLTNLMPEDYLTVLGATACAVGNSSSFVRDAGFFGTPVVLVGNRQNHREADVHATRVPAHSEAIVTAIRQQLSHGRYAPSTLYGDGHVAVRTADALAALTPYVQKHLAYGSDPTMS